FEPTPFSTIPTRLTSRPRMIGRLDAPGAHDEPVMRGLENSTSPSVPPRARRSSSLGTTVTVANWSTTIGSVPACGAATTGTGCGVGAGAAGAVRGARVVRAGGATGGRGVGRRWIGL